MLVEVVLIAEHESGPIAVRMTRIVDDGFQVRNDLFGPVDFN